MTYAAAVTIGGAVLSKMSSDQNAAAQQSANNANRAMSAEERAQQQAQFDSTQAMNREQFAQTGTIGNERAVSKRDFAGNQLGGYSAGGQQAATNQRALLGLGTQAEQDTAMAGFRDTPGQEFMRGRAEKALLRNSAKIGGLGGGTVRTALAEQGAGFAAQDYNQHMNRLQNVSSQGMQAGQAMTAADLGVSKTAGNMVAANDTKVADAAAAKAAADKAAADKKIADAATAKAKRYQKTKDNAANFQAAGY